MTVVCSCNAGGDYIPPFFIFTRQRMLPELLYGCPPGADAVARNSGWMACETFILYLAHFVKYARSSAESKVLLLVDNHVSHVSLEAINYCRSHGITMLGFLPHTTHKLQPLDVSFFGPLKTFYSQQCDSGMVSNPATAITDRQVGRLFGAAYKKAATAGNAINGFSACGIEPFNADVFDESEFAAAITTERDLLPVDEPATPVRESEDTNDEGAASMQTYEDTNDECAVPMQTYDDSFDEGAAPMQTYEDTKYEGATSGIDNSDIDDGNATQIIGTADIHFPPPQRSEMPANIQHINQERSVLDDGDAIVEIENDTPSKPVSPWDILPLPNAERPFSKRKSNMRSSAIITGSPMTNALELKLLEKKENKDRKRQRMEEKERRHKVKT